MVAGHDRGVAGPPPEIVGKTLDTAPVIRLTRDMTTTPQTQSKEAHELLHGDVLVWDGRRVRISDALNYGDHVEIRGIEIAVRRKFVLRHNGLAPVLVEVSK